MCARTRERCQCRGRARGQPRERLPCPGKERSARRVGCTELMAHGCAELCEHSGGTCHPQVPARRSAGRSHPALGLSCSCPVSPGQSPACAGGSLAAFFPVSPSAARAAAKPRGSESSFLELRLARRHPRRSPATSGSRIISSQPGPAPAGMLPRPRPAQLGWI